MAYTSQCLLQIKAKPCVSLTAPNHNNFEQVSLTVWFFLDSVAQSLKTHLRIYSMESQARFTDKEVI